MSFKAMAWATEQTITETSPQSHLLLILASFANEQNECYPSIATIEKKTRLSHNTIRKCIKELIDFGLISDTKKTSKFNTKVYKLNVDLVGVDTSNLNDTPTNFGSPTNFNTPTKNGMTPLPNLNYTPTKFGYYPLPNLVVNPVINPININHKETSEYETHTSQTDENHQSPKKPKTTAKTSSAKKPKLTDCPDNIDFTSNQLEKCQKHGLDIDELFDDFKNYHLSKGNKFRCWVSAFSTWISNEIKFNKNHQQLNSMPNRMNELRQMANNNPTNVFVDDLPPHFNQLGVNHE